MEEFWNNQVTTASWDELQELSKKYQFAVIGGWAVYLWTKQQKSKDIDIVVDFKVLQQLRADYGNENVTKNDKLRKYQIIRDKFDIDIYVQFYSKLAIQPEKLETTKIQGITVVSAENLLALKQSAEIDRRGSPKGQKDAIDILSLLLHSGVNLDKYIKLLKKYELTNYENELKSIIKNFNIKDLKYLSLGFKEFRKRQKEILAQLKNTQS